MTKAALKKPAPKKVTLKNLLADRKWRLSNLYSIKSAEKGRITKFVPRREQQQVFDALLAGRRRILILKARRLGISTAIGVYLTDQVAFNAGLQCSIVDQTQDDASRKLNSICKVAFDSLPPTLHSRFKKPRSNDSALEVSTVADDTISAIYAGKNARGGTNQFLHISEWGPIQADDPRRSEEILTGAIPSAEHGTVLIETTWKGGRGGHLWSIVQQALETSPKTNDDWELFFFPWFTDASYTSEGDVVSIEPEILKYFAEREAELQMQFTDGQKIWYARKRRELGMFIWREFPTTLDECFRAPIEGAIYAGILDKLRVAGAISHAPVDESALVHTAWDLGSPLNTVVWYFQLVGQEIRLIDCDTALDLTPVQRVAHMLAKGYHYGWHYLPHDAMATPMSGRTFNQELLDAGLKNTRIVPRTHDVWVGINQLRQIMPRMTFRLPNCERGVECLQNYHTLTETSSGFAKDEPVHDWSSHASDALRMLAEAQMAGMLEGGSATATEGRRNHLKPRVLMGSRSGNRFGNEGQRPRVLR